MLGCLVSLPIAIFAPIAFAYSMPSKAGEESGTVGAMAFLAAAGPVCFALAWFFLETAQDGEKLDDASTFKALDTDPEAPPEYVGEPASALALATGPPGYGMEDPWGRPTGPRRFNPMVNSYPSMPSGTWRGWYWQYGYTHNVCEVLLP